MLGHGYHGLIGQLRPRRGDDQDAPVVERGVEPVEQVEREAEDMRAYIATA